MKNNKPGIILLIIALPLLQIESEEIEIEKVEVVDSYNEEHEKTEQPEKFTTIVKIEEIDETKNLAEVLAECSEIFIKDTGGEAGISTVSIRGSSSKNVLILLDGTPLNTGGNSSVDISMIPASSIERIEIIRGGDAALYGSGAMGGVINIISKKAKTKVFKTSVEGTAFRGVDTVINAGDKTEFHNFFFSCQYTYDLGNFLYLDNNGTEFNQADDTLKNRAHNDAEKISFLLNHQLFFLRDMILGFHLNYNKKHNSIGGPLTFENHFSDAHLENNLINTSVNFNSGNALSAFAAEVALNLKHDSFHYVNPQEYGGGSVETGSSVLYFNSKVHTQFFGIPGNLLHVTGEFACESMPGAPRRLEAAGILRDEWYNPAETFGFLPTLRFQYNSDLSRKTRLLWNLGLFWYPQETLKLKLNAYHAFRNPDFYELYYTYGEYVGNPDLKPEISYGGDLGFHFEKNSLFLEGVLFCTDYSNLIQYLLSYGFVYKPMNFDNVLSYGGEFRYNQNLLKRLNLQLSYTLNFLNNYADLAKGIVKQFPGHPLHNLSGKLEYRHPHLNAGSLVKFEDRIGITHSGLKYIPRKVIINLFAKTDWQIETWKMNTSLFVFANNILNIYTTDVRNYPLEGFNVEVGLSLEF